MIFISHSASDNKETRELIFELAKRRVPMWVDEHSLKAGTRTYDDISTAIQNAAAVLFVLSEQALKSKYVADEIRLADKFKKPMIPIILPNTPLQLVPASVHEYKYYNIDQTSTYIAVAHQIAEVYAEQQSNNSLSALWIRDKTQNYRADLQIELNLPGIDSLHDGEYSIRLFDSDYEDLAERASAASSIDMSWFAEAEIYGSEVTRSENLPVWIAAAIAYLQKFIALYSKTPQREFEKHLLTAFISSLMKSIRIDLEHTEYYESPSEENARQFAIQKATWQTAELFDGEMEIDVCLDGDLISSLIAPRYVELIDLMPGLVPGNAVLLRHDLGSATGWLLGAKLWRKIKTEAEAETQATFPSIDQITVGPA